MINPCDNKVSFEAEWRGSLEPVTEIQWDNIGNISEITLNNMVTFTNRTFQELTLYLIIKSDNGCTKRLKVW
jgi:hypothetical protein